MTSTRWLQLIGSMAFVAVLAGCDGSAVDSGSTTVSTVPRSSTSLPDQEGTSQSSDEVQGTLTLWWTATQETLVPWMEEFIEDFEAEYPATSIEFTPLSDQEQLAKVAGAFAVGEEPDILSFAAGELLDQYVRAGRIAPLNDLVDFGFYNPASLALVTDESGSVFAVPWQWTVMVLWANEDILNAHGIDSLQTWSDLIAACDTLNSAGVVPIALGNGGELPFMGAHWYDSILYQYGGPRVASDATFGDSGAEWTDQEFVDAATRLTELVDAECFPPGFTGLDYTQGSSIFLRGEAGMIYTGSWLGSNIVSEGVGFDVGLLPLPDGSGAINSTASLDGVVGGSSVLAATQKGVDRNPLLVSTFLDSLGARMDELANVTSSLSVAADPQPEGGPIQEGLTDLLSKVGEQALWGHLTVPNAVRVVEFQNVQSLMSGDLTPQEFAQRMAEDVEQERPNFPVRGELPQDEG